jgi:hypothetical protein
MMGTPQAALPLHEALLTLTSGTETERSAPHENSDGSSAGNHGVWHELAPVSPYAQRLPTNWNLQIADDPRSGDQTFTTAMRREFGTASLFIRVARI